MVDDLKEYAEKLASDIVGDPEKTKIVLLWGRCHFCETEVADPNSRFPVIMLGEFSHEDDNTRRSRKWKQRIVHVPRCTKCRILHDKAINKVGNRWATKLFLGSCILAFSATLAVKFFGDAGAALSVLIGIPLFFVMLGIVTYGARREDYRGIMGRDRTRIMGRLPNGIKPPEAYITFQPIAEQLHGDWNAYVSRHCLYGAWYNCFEFTVASFLGLAGNPDWDCYPERIPDSGWSPDISPYTEAKISEYSARYEAVASDLAKSRDGVKQLSFAAYKGDVAAVKDLLSRDVNVNIPNDEGWTPLLTASREGHLELVRELLARGANVNARENPNNSRGGYTPLLIACHQGHPEVARLLVGKGADVNARTNHGWTALSAAEFKGDSELKAFLLKAGAK
jgi:hypothetical protein